MVLSMECKSCGAQVSESSSACPYCQAAIAKPLATQETIAIPSQPAAVPQKIKPKGKTSVLILLVLFFWPAAIWYAVTRDMSK
jgi:hypothetical protein